MPSGGDRRIVHIVDDNASFRKAIDALLTRFGYEVSAYPSARHLLDYLPNDEVPGCILLDVRLPEMSGPELAVKLRVKQPRLPVLYMSGYTDDVLSTHELSQETTAFLRKPFGNAELVAGARALLDAQASGGQGRREPSAELVVPRRHDA